MTLIEMFLNSTRVEAQDAHLPKILVAIASRDSARSLKYAYANYNRIVAHVKCTKLEE